jgi:hypothetical protein
MRPTNKLFLFALIIFLLFGTVPVVHAQTAATAFTGTLTGTVICADSPQSYGGTISQLGQIDYWEIKLAAGQKLIIDVDAEKIGSSLDAYLVVLDKNEYIVGLHNDEANGNGRIISLDPYLEVTAPSEDYYYIGISSAVTEPQDDSDEDEDPQNDPTVGPYTFLVQCSDQPAPSEFTWPVVDGDLLGATGSNPGSLINITPANAESTLPFPLGVGPIADIEYQYSTDTLLVAINQKPGNIITFDPATGDQGKTYSLVPSTGTVVPTVVALEAAEKELYGIQVDPSNEEYSLVLVTFDDTALTATLAHVFSFGKQQVRTLAYHQSERVMYAASGTDLLKIDLASPPDGIPEVVELTDLSFEIASMDFSHENVLYVVDVKGNLYEITELTNGEVKLINPINTTGGVSGLTFVVGESPDVEPIKTICSSTLTSPMTASSESGSSKLSRFKLKNRMRRAIGLFKFQAIAGENITIHLAPEVEESAEAGEKSTLSTMEQLWPGWRGKGRVFLGVRDSIPGVDLRVRKKNTLPMDLEVTNLPATGSYYIMVIRPLFRLHKADYCLTLESDDPENQAWQTLQVAWPDEEDKDEEDEDEEDD